MSIDVHKIALFIDFENLETGVRKQYETRTTLEPIITELSELGVIIVRRAYGDWVQHANYRHPLLQGGIEPVERPNISPGKNDAGIKLSIDAVETALRNPKLDTFAIVSGNGDFLPLIQKLRELDRQVIVIGVEACTSNLLRKNCDKYYAYDTLANLRQRDRGLPRDVVRLLERAIRSRDEQDSRLDPAEVKRLMHQLDASFNERDHGFNNFNDMLDHVGKQGILPLKLEFQDGAWNILLMADISPRSRPYSPGHETRRPEWQNRPMTEEEWEIMVEAVKQCILEGKGRPNQGKLWIINAYLHRKRLDGRLSLVNTVLFDALQALARKGVLEHPNPDTYLLAEDFEVKKEEFLDELFGVEVGEEVKAVDEAGQTQEEPGKEEGKPEAAAAKEPKAETEPEAEPEPETEPEAEPEPKAEPESEAETEPELEAEEEEEEELDEQAEAEREYQAKAEAEAKKAKAVAKAKAVVKAKKAKPGKKIVKGGR